MALVAPSDFLAIRIFRDDEVEFVRRTEREAANDFVPRCKLMTRSCRCSQWPSCHAQMMKSQVLPIRAIPEVN